MKSRRILSVILTICMLLSLAAPVFSAPSAVKTYDNAEEIVIASADEEQATAALSAQHKHCVCGGDTNIGDHTSHSDIEFVAWNKTDSMPTDAGNYVLMNDVTIDSSWHPTDGTTLCLNGHTLQYKNSTENGSVIVVDVNKSFTLCDCQGNSGKITGGTGDRYRNTNSYYGGGVYVGGSFTMYGGSITANYANNSGGGIYLYTSASFSMYGGHISSNTADAHGGGVYAGGNFSMYGGEISKNTGYAAGGVNVGSYGASFVMSGGSITENHANNENVGGGVRYLQTESVLLSGDVSIINNTSGEANRSSDLEIIYIDSSLNKITVGALGETAQIGVDVKLTDPNYFFTAVTISVGGGVYASSFFSNNAAYTIVADGENLKLVESKPVQVGQVELANGEYTTDGINKTAGTPTGEGYAYYKNGVLTLNNFTYTGSGDNNAAIYATNDLTINAVGTNTIDSTEEYAIYLKGSNLAIKGDVLNLAVSNSEKAITTLTLYNDFDGTYGKLNITDVTLNVENKSDDQSYGIRCRDVLIDGSTLTVNMKKEKQHRSTGLDANGTVAIVRNSQVVIDLSEATTGSALIADGSVSVSDSYVELRGDANGSTGLSFNTSYRTLEFGGGTLIISGTRDHGGAIYMYNATVELPDDDYWWRTDENGSYTKGGYTYNTSQTYIELTTTEQHNYTYTLSDYDTLLTETCAFCDHTATAKIEGEEYPTYNGSKVEARVVYSDNWIGERPTEIKYYIDWVESINLVSEAIDVGEYVAAIEIEGNLVHFYFVICSGRLYVTANDNQITYGEAPVGDGVEVTGFVNGENESVLNGTLAYDFDYAQYGDVGTYTITPKGLTADNYSITYEPGTLTVVAAQPQIQATTTASKIRRGKALAKSSLTIGEFIGLHGEIITGTVEWLDGTEIMEEKGTFQRTVVFTPDESFTNYTAIEFDVDITVLNSSGGASTADYTNSKTDDTPKQDVEETTDEWQNPYKDISVDDPYYDIVKLVTEKGIMNGVESDRFAPNENVTRAMFVTMLYRLEGEPEIEEDTAFEDVKDGAYYQKAVAWANKNGIVLGYSQTQFAPNDNITREQVSAIVYRYASFKSFDTSVGENTNILSYTDFDKISEYAIEAVQWACGIGALTGREDGSLEPRVNATRIEAALALTKIN